MSLTDPSGSDFSVRAFAFGDIVLLALDGTPATDFDRIRLKRLRKVVAEATLADLAQNAMVHVLDYPGFAQSAGRFLDRLARTIFTAQTTGVIAIPVDPLAEAIELSFIKGRSRVGRPLAIVPRRIHTIVGAPIGVIAPLFTASATAEGLPDLVVGGHPLPCVASESFGGMIRRDFSIPSILFDGEPHNLDLTAGGEAAEFVLPEWACAPPHALPIVDAAVKPRPWPNAFPDHEIYRIASFASAPGRHSVRIDPATFALWRAGQSREESPPIRLFVFDITLLGALTTPAVAQMRERHRDWIETIVVLPTREAERFGDELTRATAASQSIDVITIGDLPALLEEAPDDAVIMMVAGGATLADEALDELYAVIDRRSAGICAAVTHKISADAVTLRITESGERPLDLSEGIAIWPKKAALRYVQVSHEEHEGAEVPLARLAEPYPTHLGERPYRLPLAKTDYGFSCVIDAQSNGDDELFDPVLEKLVKASIPLVVVGSHKVIRKISQNEALAGIRVLGSPEGKVAAEYEGELFRSGTRPVIYISFDMLRAMDALVDDVAPLLDTVVQHTTSSSRCAPSLSDAARDDHLAALGDFGCTKVFA